MFLLASAQGRLKKKREFTQKEKDPAGRESRGDTMGLPSELYKKGKG